MQRYTQRFLRVLPQHMDAQGELCIQVQASWQPAVCYPRTSWITGSCWEPRNITMPLEIRRLAIHICPMTPWPLQALAKIGPWTSRSSHRKSGTGTIHNPTACRNVNMGPDQNQTNCPTSEGLYISVIWPWHVILVNASVLLARHSQWCTEVVCTVSWMSTAKPTGHLLCSIVPSSSL